MKKGIFATILMAMCLTLFACGGDAAETPARVEVPDYVLTAAGVEPAPLIGTWANPDAPAAAVAQGANDFAFRLSAALLQDVDYQNFVVSPYSVWLPFAALINAVDEAHRQEFIKALAGEGISIDDINRAASRMLFDLTNEGHRREGREGFEGDPLQIANAIFVDYSHTLRTEFAQTFMDYFRGESINIDFSSPYAVAAINQWAGDNTNGLINDVIQELCPDTFAAIVNAIYFAESWTSPFDPDYTERDVFHAPTGDVEVYFMRQHFNLIGYFEDENMQSLTMFFFNGGMTILLPKDGDAVGLLAGMTNEEFNRIRSNHVLGRGDLHLPRFNVESSLGLIPALSALGLESLFCGFAAPIDGLVYDPRAGWITQAVQVAMLDVDEAGAIAAAVTVAAGGLISLPPPPQVRFEMICNTPFAFVLYMRTADGERQILFTGVVNDPS